MGLGVWLLDEAGLIGEPDSAGRGYRTLQSPGEDFLKGFNLSDTPPAEDDALARIEKKIDLLVHAFQRMAAATEQLDAALRNFRYVDTAARNSGTDDNFDHSTPLGSIDSIADDDNGGITVIATLTPEGKSWIESRDDPTSGFPDR